MQEILSKPIERWYCGNELCGAQLMEGQIRDVLITDAGPTSSRVVGYQCQACNRKMIGALAYDAVASIWRWAIPLMEITSGTLAVAVEQFVEAARTNSVKPEGAAAGHAAPVEEPPAEEPAVIKHTTTRSARKGKRK